MITTVLRLEFENVFPEQKAKSVLEYLQSISPKTLLYIIGFSNTSPQPNYDNIHSNLQIRNDIISRVTFYCFQNKIKIKPCVVSREASLKLAEIILENRKELIEKSTVKTLNIDNEETNLLKAFLIINKEVNTKAKYSLSTQDNIEKIAETLITMSFSTADLGLFEDNDAELGKLILTTLSRFEQLLDFLKSNNNYKYLEHDLCSYFSLNTIEELRREVKILFFELLNSKILNNGYKFNVKGQKSQLFLESLVSNEIIKDDDFTALRNHPIYKIENEVYSIIDYFFVVDKFYKSVRFILKNSFNKKHNLPDKDRTFFDFFNTKFSEEFLMKNILDKIFADDEFSKKEIVETDKNEPDYYARRGNIVYLFENKDVLIAKAIKSSGNIETILNTLKQKFLESNGKPIGIGQLITSITQIVQNNFKYDKYVNTSDEIVIYPILLVSDRIYEIPGINFILNKWYLAKVKESLKDAYNSKFISDLTIIDIDTLIYWLPHLEENISNFSDIVDKHLSEMRTFKKAIGITRFELEDSINKNIYNHLSPISYRFPEYKFPSKVFIEKFEEVMTK